MLSDPPRAPLSVYVHLPWCVRKCPYCDFNSHAQREAIPETRYLDALTADLEQALPQVWGRTVSSIFIGGGTPSLFTPAGIDRLLTTLRTLLHVAPGAEITMEANPGTFEAARFRGYREAGVNRLSLGIQSFNPGHLKALGRIHDEREAHMAAEAAMSLFETVNLDLMYALPGQSLEQARADLEVAIGLGTQHLSAYHLTLEPNTPFAAAPPPLPDDDLAAVADLERICTDCRIFYHECAKGIPFRTRTVQVAADQNRSPAGIAGSVDKGLVKETYILAKSFDRPTKGAGLIT